MSKSKPKLTNPVSEIEKKWTKPLVAAGWTAIPTVIFDRQAALGLDPLDINSVLHLAGCWWTAGNSPYPSKSTIAAAIGVHPRTVQRRLARLEGARFIKRIARHKKKGGRDSNAYSLEGLIKAATPYALERIEEKIKRTKAAAERVKRKRPVLSLVKW